MADHVEGRFRTMLDQGGALVSAGETSPAEVLRMVKESGEHAVI